MNKRQPRKTPPHTSAKRYKPAAPIPVSPAVTAQEAQERQKELDHLLAEAMQACVEQGEYCCANPYDTPAFTAYEKAVDAWWKALRLADPERYALDLPRRLEMEAAYPRGWSGGGAVAES